MNRHPLNVFSLVFGVVLILMAVWATWVGLPERGWSFDVPDWSLPAAAILVGAALMSPLFTKVQRRKTSGDGTAGEEFGEGRSD